MLCVSRYLNGRCVWVLDSDTMTEKVYHYHDIPPGVLGVSHDGMRTIIQHYMYDMSAEVALRVVQDKTKYQTLPDGHLTYLETDKYFVRLSDYCTYVETGSIVINQVPVMYLFDDKIKGVANNIFCSTSRRKLVCYDVTEVSDDLVAIDIIRRLLGYEIFETCRAKSMYAIAAMLEGVHLDLYSLGDDYQELAFDIVWPLLKTDCVMSFKHIYLGHSNLDDLILDVMAYADVAEGTTKEQYQKLLLALCYKKIGGRDQRILSLLDHWLRG